MPRQATDPRTASTRRPHESPHSQCSATSHIRAFPAGGRGPEATRGGMRWPHRLGPPRDTPGQISRAIHRADGGLHAKPLHDYAWLDCAWVAHFGELEEFPARAGKLQAQTFFGQRLETWKSRNRTVPDEPL